MSFGFQNTGGNGAGGGAVAQTGPDLQDIRTASLAFKSINVEKKIQLCTPWPADNLPPPTASLLSVAQHKGLVSAAGPDGVIVATTDSMRKAYGAEEEITEEFRPQLQIPMPMRISQLAFSGDESYLVLSAEVGGGLAVYDVQALMNGSTQSAFELSTNGQALKALIPNPTAEKGELFAIVTADGNLLMANLKERSFVSGPNGQILKSNVTCLSWSTKGKQLVAGLGDGTACQMTPEGVEKGLIPRPPNVDNSCQISSITWLENHVFLLAHTPRWSGGDAPNSLWNIATRTPPSSFVFQKLEEPAGPWGMNRSPPHHFVQRLKDFPPSMQDMVVTTSTAASDIGLFTRSKVALDEEKPVTDQFTLTEMAEDYARAVIPLSGAESTSAIGLALDLSCKDTVVKPIEMGEEDVSATPLPGLMVLNHEGVLAFWWIVYFDSIRQKTIYPGLVAAGGAVQSQASPAPVQASSAFGASPSPAFGVPSAPNPFGARPAPSFGTASGAFGAPSGLGQKSSPWGTPTAGSGTAIATTGPTFGTSTFGSSGFPKPANTSAAPAFGSPGLSQPTPAAAGPAFGTPAFGSTGPLQKASPWGTPASTTQGTAFGQPSGLGKSPSLFGAGANSTPTPSSSASGFAAFATKGGFASAGQASTGSVFGAKPGMSVPPATSVFGAPSVITTSVFGSSAVASSSPFGSQAKPTSLLGSTPFSLGSTFKADTSSKGDERESASGSKTSFFGGGFGGALDSATTAVSKEADMDTTDDAFEPKEAQPTRPQSTTPAPTPAPAKPSGFGSASGGSGLFGTPNSATTTPVPKPAASAGFSFGNAAPTASKPQGLLSGFGTASSSRPASLTQAPSAALPPASPKIKEEPASPKLSGRLSEPPLPPDPTSKTSYAAGDTSVSSTGSDAPLPPDFVPKPTRVPSPLAAPASKPIPAHLIPPMDVPGGPEDDGDESGFGSSEDGEREGEVGESEEGSGEDVTQDLSPASEVNETPAFTPQTSFNNISKATPDNTFFNKISKPGQPEKGRSLFGEIGSTAPVLLAPKMQASPRSPSPTRSGALPGRMLRPENSRSVSAPGVASGILARKAPAPSQSTFELSLQQNKAEDLRREVSRARKEQEETQALVDDEDDRLQEFLASDLQATLKLEEFTAHAEYFGLDKKDSVPAQIETVFRDINAMIDTLGLNARSLKCFAKGHEEQYKDGGRTKEDLDKAGDWCLAEIEDLSNVVEKELGRELQIGRVKDVPNKLDICNDLQKDAKRLQDRRAEVQKAGSIQLDPNVNSKARLQPLSTEQTVQQNDLRRDFTNFQKLLSDAEESLAILKTKIVSQATPIGHHNGSAITVDAVMRTITKMTSMAEKRSGDIDVLENQMRKLRFGSAPRSREGSPFTPQTNRASVRNLGTSGTYGLFYTPESTRDTPSRFQNSLMSSTSSHMFSSPPRKKLSGYSAEDKAHIRSKLARKKEVTNKLKEALKRSGPNVKLMDDDDNDE